MIQIIYWSGTGNTKLMAENIAEGIKEKRDVKVVQVSDAGAQEIIDSEIVVLGCPAMGAEELEDTEMLPFIEAHQALFSGKKIALFGSYGWGTGEWMDSWKEQMEEMGATLVVEPLIVNEFTSGQDEAICLEYGKQMIK